MTAPLVRWRAVSQQEFLWAHWGGEHVLYHRPSGLTHLINEVTASLLREVLLEARTVDDAAVELAQREGAEMGAEFIDDVQFLVERLETLGLVERCDE